MKGQKHAFQGSQRQLAASVAGLLLVLSCQRAPTAQPVLTPVPSGAAVSTATPVPASGPNVTRTTPPGSPSPGDLSDPFPAATTTTASGHALLWSPWPMEGRDPQRSGRAAAVGVAQPMVSWTAVVDNPSFGQPVFAADGSLYVGTDTGKLLAFAPAGLPAWEFSTTGPIPTPAVGPDGTVYLRGGDGTFFALRPDGRRRWTTDIGAPPQMLGPAPLVGPDSYGYLASYHSSMLYLVQPGGFFQWAYNAKARTLGGTAVGADGVIYVGAADGKFRALDRELVEQWSFDAGAPITSAPAVAADGTVVFLVGGPQPGLVALDRGGQKLWSVASCWEAGAPVLWPAVAADGRVQVANCAIGPDGQVRWKSDLAGPWATPAVLDADGNAYFGSGSVLNSVAPDGHLRWSYESGGRVNPPSLGAFGSVAFTTQSADRLHVLAR